jgi:hydroxypyruvate isomerase
MPRFAANLTMMFNERPFLERFAAAAQAGFKGVEYLFPYEHDKSALKQALADNGLAQVLHNLPAGNWQTGERGIACHPDRVKEFNEGVDRAIDYATALGCSQLNCLAGMPPAGADPADVRATFVGNLQRAASKLKAAGIRLLIEPINTRDIPNFFLSHTAQAIEIIRAVGSDNLFLQYDVYHMQIMEGDLTKTIERQLPQIAHMQVADPPLRNEPGSGEINFTNLFRAIDKLGYTGWIGCEYKPAGKTEDGLGWYEPYRTT